MQSHTPLSYNADHFELFKAFWRLLKSHITDPETQALERIFKRYLQGDTPTIKPYAYTTVGMLCIQLEKFIQKYVSSKNKALKNFLENLHANLIHDRDHPKTHLPHLKVFIRSFIDEGDEKSQEDATQKSASESLTESTQNALAFIEALDQHACGSYEEKKQELPTAIRTGMTIAEKSRVEINSFLESKQSSSLLETEAKKKTLESQINFAFAQIDSKKYEDALILLQHLFAKIQTLESLNSRYIHLMKDIMLGLRRIYNIQGLDYLNNARLQLAEENFKKAISLNEGDTLNDLTHKFNLAICFIKAKKFSEALSLLEEIHEKCHKKLDDSTLDRSQGKQAQDIYNQIYCELQSTYFHLASQQLNNKELQLAENNFKKAVYLSKYKHESYRELLFKFGLAKTWFIMDKHKDALVLLNSIHQKLQHQINHLLPGDPSEDDYKDLLRNVLEIQQQTQKKILRKYINTPKFFEKLQEIPVENRALVLKSYSIETLVMLAETAAMLKLSDYERLVAAVKRIDGIPATLIPQMHCAFAKKALTKKIAHINLTMPFAKEVWGEFAKLHCGTLKVNRVHTTFQSQPINAHRFPAGAQPRKNKLSLGTPRNSAA